VTLALLSLPLLSTLAASEPSQPGTPWPAVDALGRALPLAAEVGPPKPDRLVGIFYFLWHEKGMIRARPGGGPYDVSQILAADPDALRHATTPPWGPIGTYHYWGEPLFGYYLDDDPWVIRRHAQLLADAGVDTLIFDATNAITYHETCLKLCGVYAALRAEGQRTPQFAFMVNTKAGETAQKLYDELYRPGLYPELWFRWQGKPLLLCDPQAAPAPLREFFTLRAAHWPFTMVNTRNAWHWEATYPQPYGYTDDPQRPEQVNVSVAQNLAVHGGAVANMSSGQARGRGFHDGRADHSAAALDGGANFAEQWRRALQLDPPFVMVTGWNEWIAGRWGKPEASVFVDQYDREYSRDIEPMRGGHGDNYYCQMMAGIRRYKGAPPLPAAGPPAEIRIAGGFEQWAAVTPEYLGASAGPPRDHDGAGGLHYTHAGARNSFEAMKVGRDAGQVYFYARLAQPPADGGAGLTLWLRTRPDGPSWAGFDQRVRRGPDGRWTLQRWAGDAGWQAVGAVESRLAGRELHLAAPRAALGLTAAALTIDFKWSDNLPDRAQALDFYSEGSVAPSGRLMFRYAAEPG